MIAAFLALTFGLSILGYAGVRLIPGAASPDAPRGLPAWLLMVWGPSLAALILAARDGTLPDLLERCVRISGVPWLVWALVLAPLALLYGLRNRAPAPRSSLRWPTIAGMIAFNLILGPMGEELGWRGVLQPALAGELGWLAASLLVGVIWCIWHMPLWTFDSPHAQISLPLFCGHCMAYSVLLGASVTLSDHALLPAIALHLTLNLASNAALFVGFTEPNDWFRASLPAYLALAGLTALFTQLTLS